MQLWSKQSYLFFCNLLHWGTLYWFYKGLNLSYITVRKELNPATSLVLLFYGKRYFNHYVSITPIKQPIRHGFGTQQNSNRLKMSNGSYPALWGADVLYMTFRKSTGRQNCIISVTRKTMKNTYFGIFKVSYIWCYYIRSTFGVFYIFQEIGRGNKFGTFKIH